MPCYVMFFQLYSWMWLTVKFSDLNNFSVENMNFYWDFYWYQYESIKLFEPWYVKIFNFFNEWLHLIYWLSFFRQVEPSLKTAEAPSNCSPSTSRARRRRRTHVPDSITRNDVPIVDLSDSPTSQNSYSRYVGVRLIWDSNLHLFICRAIIQVGMVESHFDCLNEFFQKRKTFPIWLSSKILFPTILVSEFHKILSNWVSVGT